MKRALPVIAAVLCVVVPFLGWHQTWFGRKLGDRELSQYLQDQQHPRRIQHALFQIVQRIERGDPQVRQWYPQVAELGRHPMAKIRITAAWVMGQDNREETFHTAVRDLLGDSDLMVRRNAALALVRFGDAGGRGELKGMLHSQVITAPEGGRVSFPCRAGQKVEAGTLLARVRGEVEVRSPFAGQVETLLAADGSEVPAGTPLVAVAPGADQVWEALRGLYLVGQPQDLAEVDRYRQTAGEIPERLREQAVLTAQAIRTRGEPKSNR